ncbi:MAG: hypothetical protein GF388_04140, partial [Candidatus Aegiribacteria sp.]|nr:hypothetical protein [Candidatus Aegiribacteria sp.]MBD3294430.1 hypothetical protein [Candidatus Fermentibacteria bacterium]
MEDEMKSASIIALIMIAIPAPLLLAQAPENCSPSKHLAAGNSLFALELFREVSDPDGMENFFFSPFSVSAALGMTYAGAEGITASEMERVLHFTLPQDSIGIAFRDLIGSLSSGDLAGAESGDPFTLAIS